MKRGKEKKERNEDRNGFGVTFKRPPPFFEMPQKRKKMSFWKKKEFELENQVKAIVAMYEMFNY